MRFELTTAARIVFGPGTLAELGPIARELGHNVLLVTGRDPRRAERACNLLGEAGLATTTFTVAHEPTVDEIARGVAASRACGADVVVGCGGGSAIDAAKAISALVANPGDVFDYLEVVGRAQPLRHPSVPCVAIPTTAGTGAEVTRNAVLASPQHGVKVSLRSPHLLPRVALVDPELTLELPPVLTASTGLDALTQLIEPYVCSRANPLTDSWCVEGLRRASRSLRRACENGRDAAAREDMSFASLLGGLALANAGLGAAHGFAAPIGGRFSAPHGAVCARLLPPVMAANLHALRSRAPHGPALARYADIARIVTGRGNASADDAVTWVRELVDGLSIPPLRAYGISRDDIPDLVAAASIASSMKANPIALTPAELTTILENAL
jgi:alcohol dehydrogenase class IV